MTITAQTRYPYQQSVDFSIQPAQPSFPVFAAHPGLVQPGRPHGQRAGAGRRHYSRAAFSPSSACGSPGTWCGWNCPFELALEHWPDGGVSLTYGPLTLALPIPTRAEIETENSTTLQRQNTLGDEYEPRPAVVRPDFPAWNLYPGRALELCAVCR